MYYNDYLSDELLACEEIFSQKIETNEKWFSKVEKVFQDNNTHNYFELQTNMLEYLINYAGELALKYHINLKAEIDKIL